MPISTKLPGVVAVLVLASCFSDAQPIIEQPPPPPGPIVAPDAGPEPDAAVPPDAATSRPNVVFILTDDLSWNLVRYMPNVLRMQKEGMTFSNYFVTDSLCCPSRSSILTGRFPHDTGVFTNGGDDGGYEVFKAKGNETATFATSLSAAGYRTALMGKYLNGYDPLVPAIPPGWTSWAGAGAAYRSFDYDLNENGVVRHYGTAATDYVTDVLGGRGVGFVAADPLRPFFLEMATFSPHAPYTPAPRDAELFPGLSVPRTPAYGARPGPTAPAWLAAIPALTKKEEKKMDEDFRKRVQAVQAIDRMIENLRDAVKAAGHADDTYFVFSSDNGFHMGEHSLRTGKQTAFDTDIHVPLVVVGPGVPAGTTADAIVQNIDLCATFAEIGGAEPPPKQTGRSLLALLHGKTADWRNVALVEHHGAHFDATDPDLPEPDSGDPPTYSALRTRSYVYVEYVGGEVEYHAHATDPDELDNTAAALTTTEKDALHGTLEAMKTCHDVAGCWTAQHLLPGAPAP